ncbi:trypsin [Xylocopa sonorina]|uniref:trypsin n=1 Tax=Xylocopa sonorina TaxID=1818115 RepID=UPI00403B03EF
MEYGLSGRIVNGTEAQSRQFPYQVSLRRSYNGRHFCGGSLIDKKFVLTAAHCLVKDGATLQPWTITVVAGELRLSQSTSTGQWRGVEAIHVHSEYNEATLQNDIAILVMTTEFVINLDVTNVPLISGSPLPYTICQVSGWGYPDENANDVTDSLMYVDLPLLSSSRCKALLANITDFPPGMLCAGYEEGQKDACQGDSGGGMLCNGMLTGVVSGGNGCARPGYPGVYTDVDYYRGWIEERINSAYNKGDSQITTITLLPSVLLSVLFRN